MLPSRKKVNRKLPGLAMKLKLKPIHQERLQHSPSLIERRLALHLDRDIVHLVRTRQSDNLKRLHAVRIHDQLLQAASIRNFASRNMDRLRARRPDQHRGTEPRPQEAAIPRSLHTHAPGNSTR
jgi:hypothetical protein